MHVVMHDQIGQPVFDPVEYPNTYQYVRQLLVRNRRCRKCGSPVLKSDDPKYDYQCMCCDEDLKKKNTFETPVACSNQDILEVCLKTKDLMQLDDKMCWGGKKESFDLANYLDMTASNKIRCL